MTQAVPVPLQVPATSPARLRRITARLRHAVTVLWEPGTRLLLVPLAVLSVVSFVATAASPMLVDHPLILIALSPRVAFLAVAATKVQLLPFMVVGGVRLAVTDPIHYLLGARFGPRRAVGPSWYRWTRALGVPAAVGAVLCWPNGRHLFVAGALKARVAWIVTADLVGTVAYLLSLRGATGGIA